MDEPVIRRAWVTDAEQMAACVEAAYHRYIPRMGKPPGPMLADYAAEIRDHDSFVLDLNGQVIGVLVLHRDGQGVLLDNVAVLPEFQGKGYGRMLISFAEKETRKYGFDQITLYTNERMTENIALYQALGFVEYERATVDGYPRVYMRKPLG